MAEETRSADQLVNILLREPERLKAIAAQKNPAKALEKAADEAIARTRIPPKAYMVVVYALGTVGVVSVIGIIMLVAIGKTAPDMLVALGSAAIGALAGLLVRPPTEK